MFNRAQRLTSKRIFERLFRGGVWVRGRLFSLRVMPTHQSGQIAFIINKKVAKSAQQRNRVKRRVREAFRHTLQKSPFSDILKHYHLLVIIHQSTEPPFETIVTETQGLLTKLLQMRPQ